MLHTAGFLKLPVAIQSSFIYCAFLYVYMFVCSSSGEILPAMVVLNRNGDGTFKSDLIFCHSRFGAPYVNFDYNKHHLTTWLVMVTRARDGLWSR